MKKHAILSVVTISLAATLLFAGCSPKKTPAPAPDDSQGTQTPVTPEEVPSVPEEETPVKTLSALIGKPDADVTAVLGDGTKTDAQDGALQLREYSADIYAIASQLAVNYEGGNVSSVTVYAGENKFDDWATPVTTELGEPDYTAGSDEDGNDSREMSWNLDGGVVVSLREAYGALSLDFFVGA